MFEGPSYGGGINGDVGLNANINGYDAGADLNTNLGMGGTGFPGGEFGGDFNNAFGGNISGPGGFGGNISGQGGLGGGFF